MKLIAQYMTVFCVMAVAFIMETAQASIVIGGTRVVYPEQDKEVTVKLSNEGNQPLLVQTWLDTGDMQASPDIVKVPFILSPPMFRMDARTGQFIRIMYSKEPLATDKETLFWLNVLEIPPMLDGDVSTNNLQFAFRTRIKIFFRPSKLEGSIHAAADQVTWKLLSSNGTQTLVAANPTPYFVSYARVGIKVGERLIKTIGAGGMVAPKSTTTFVLDADDRFFAESVQAQYVWINDFGGQVTAESTITE